MFIEQLSCELRYWNDCSKTSIKLIMSTMQSQWEQTVQWTHQNSRQLPVNLPKVQEKLIACIRCNWFWFCFSLVAKLAQDSLGQSISKAIPIAYSNYCFQQFGFFFCFCFLILFCFVFFFFQQLFTALNILRNCAHLQGACYKVYSVLVHCTFHYYLGHYVLGTQNSCYK